MKPDDRWIGRKEICFLTGLSYWEIAANEKRLGLDKAKVVLNARRILYHRLPAMRAIEAFFKI